MNTPQTIICRCSFITYNRIDRMKHLKSKQHKIFCKEVEKFSLCMLNIKE